jgi:hypothetical protein
MISKIELRELPKQGIFRPAGSCRRRDRPGTRSANHPASIPPRGLIGSASFIELELCLIRHNVLDELPSE